MLTLTKRELEIYKLLSLGYSLDEIADMLFIASETVRKHISNIKIKLKLQKSTELVAYYWCEVFGSSLEDQRKQIVSALMVILFFYSVPLMDNKRTRSTTRSNQRIEITTRGRREYI